MFIPLVAATLALAGSSDDLAEAFATARAVIEHQESSIRSFDVEYSLEIKRFEIGPSPSDKPSIQRQSIREQRRGDRFRRIFDLVLDVDHSTEAERDLSTFDGAAYWFYSEVGKSGGKTSAGSEPTVLAHMLYTSNARLGDMLASHQDEVDATWEEIGGERLLAVGWEENGGLTRRTYYLDPKAAYQPLRYTLEFEYSDGLYPDGRKRGKALAIVQEYVRQDGVVWPKIIRLTRDLVDGNDREWRDLDRLLTINSVAFNVEMDDSMFIIDFPEGTRVNDVDRGVTYVVGEPDSEQPIIAAAPDEPAAPITGPAYEFWADWRIWLAAAGICGALLIWLKKRGLA